MARIAYLANQFPSAVEPYVAEEIRELRRSGIDVLPCSAWKVVSTAARRLWTERDVLNLSPLRPLRMIEALWLGLTRVSLLRGILRRILAEGTESISVRLRALAHTFLGLYYAALLRDCAIEHIHVHHGYFSSWIGMVAARMLGIGFSLTLHGSDLLLRGVYLDTKLEACDFCFTISQFNREYIRHAYPSVNLEKVLVQRLGVGLQSKIDPAAAARRVSPFLILAVGRLHKVKDHAFLVRACHEFRERGNSFACVIAGDGPERVALQQQISQHHLQEHVHLPGHLSSLELRRYYASSDVVVLTSRSEGIPLVLMEAMSLGKVVLAPAITGIPELVIDGRTGFLYRAGSLDEFLAKLEFILESSSTLEPIRREARRHVAEHFNREKNLTQFTKQFLQHAAITPESVSHADPVLQ